MDYRGLLLCEPCCQMETLGSKLRNSGLNEPKSRRSGINPSIFCSSPRLRDSVVQGSLLFSLRANQKLLKPAIGPFVGRDGKRFLLIARGIEAVCHSSAFGCAVR